VYTKNAWGAEIEVEEEKDWEVQTPEKTGAEQEKRIATIEKAQAVQTALVSTLTDALGKTRMECSTALAKASTAIEDSNRAANALSKHLAALDEEIEAFEKIVTNSESAASYLEAQVKKIADYIAKLTKRTGKRNGSYEENVGRNCGAAEKQRRRSQSRQSRADGGASEKTEGRTRVRTSQGKDDDALKRRRGNYFNHGRARSGNGGRR
jgi:uncharacterized coiled-coil protein SlyX